MDITRSQVARLQKLLDSGFRFVSIERVERYLGVERDGFAALLEPSEGQLRIFSQVGYRLEGGIAMLVERGEGKAFVWHDQEVPATPELLERYRRFRADLEDLLKEE